MNTVGVTKSRKDERTADVYRSAGRSQMRQVVSYVRYLRYVGYLVGGLFGLAAMALVGLAVVGQLAELPGEREISPGIPRRQSRYLRMTDGVELAVDVWFPTSLRAGQRAPALLKNTAYWRAMRPTAISRGLHALGLAGDWVFSSFEYADIPAFNERGYVVVIADVRGTGASQGDRPIPFSDREVRDYGEVIDWIAAQSWSNGRVGTFGVSYGGMAAELAATTGRAALRAMAPLYSPYDPFTELTHDNGIANTHFARQASQIMRALDANDLGSGAPSWAMKLIFSLLSRGVERVDDDPDGSKLQRFVRQRRAVYPDEGLTGRDFRDDPFGASGRTFTSVAPIGRRESLASSGVPMYVTAGWHDSAIVAGALKRFAALPVEQTLLLGALSHGGFADTDPHRPAGATTDPSPRARYDALAAFFDRHLKRGDRPDPGRSTIHYYTMGSGQWRSTPVWPPAGARPTRFFLGPDAGLARTVPDAESHDGFEVDLAASTGTLGGTLDRWMGTLAGRHSSKGALYPDRASFPPGHIAYLTPPLTEDIEISGAPLVEIFCRFSTGDGALHAYLEDVGPDGSLAHITEGALRVVHRAVSGERPLGLKTGVARTFLRRDALPAGPGQLVEMRFDMIDTSVLIRRGHRLRLRLGGHAPAMERVPRNGPAPRVQILHGTATPSSLTLPLVARPSPPPIRTRRDDQGREPPSGL
jgi:uncharacterized protein